MSGRKNYSRPQAMLWSDNSGTIQNGLYLPIGNEFEDFIVLTDHNRAEISMSQQRIENRQRMINGTMRSYWNADKLNVSTSWERLPSRSFSTATTINTSTGKYTGVGDQYIVDAGASGSDMLSWYENHSGPFWVYLAYDKDHSSLQTYSDVRLMFFSSFEYAIEKRGATNHDFWNVSVQLEEA
jgi:hypothetical protein